MHHTPLDLSQTPCRSGMIARNSLPHHARAA